MTSGSFDVTRQRCFFLAIRIPVATESQVFRKQFFQLNPRSLTFSKVSYVGLNYSEHIREMGTWKISLEDQRQATSQGTIMNQKDPVGIKKCSLKKRKTIYISIGVDATKKA